MQNNSEVKSWVSKIAENTGLSSESIENNIQEIEKVENLSVQEYKISQFSQWLISLFFKSRCQKYLKSQCDQVSKIALETLDFGFPFKNLGKFNAPAAFRKELIKSFDSGEIINYSKFLLKKMDTHPNPNVPFSLWEETLNFAEHKPKEAIRLLAITFQDSTDLGHLEFLKSMYGDQKKYSDFASDFLQLNYLLFPSRRSGEASIFKYPIEYFPKNIPSNRGSIYHFYVPAFHAQLLTEKNINKVSAKALPAFLNSEYTLALMKPKSRLKNLDTCQGVAQVKETFSFFRNPYVFLNF